VAGLIQVQLTHELQVFFVLNVYSLTRDRALWAVVADAGLKGASSHPLHSFQRKLTAQRRCRQLSLREGLLAGYWQEESRPEVPLLLLEVPGVGVAWWSAGLRPATRAGAGSDRLCTMGPPVGASGRGAGSLVELVGLTMLL